MVWKYDPVKVMSAVQKTIGTTKVPLTQVAEEAGLSRGSVNKARVIILYGTEDEIAQFKSGAYGLSDIYRRVKKHMTEEQIKEVLDRRFAGIRSEKFMTVSEQDTALWGDLRPALKSLTSLPSPKEMVGVVLRNRGREGTVNELLETATAWLMEFEHEWVSHQRQSKKDTSDA